MNLTDENGEFPDTLLGLPIVIMEVFRKILIKLSNGHTAVMTVQKDTQALTFPAFYDGQVLAEVYKTTGDFTPDGHEIFHHFLTVIPDELSLPPKANSLRR